MTMRKWYVLYLHMESLQQQACHSFTMHCAGREYSAMFLAELFNDVRALTSKNGHTVVSVILETTRRGWEVDL